MRFLPLLLFFIYAVAFSQSADSLKKPDKPVKIDSSGSFRDDSLSVPDSLKQKIHAKADTVTQIFQSPANNESSFINRKQFDFYDYRYAGDVLKSFTLNYLNDYGSIGQPNETFLYGIGNNGISYMEDGVLLNNRMQNYFDLNNLQAESIDSVEISPLPRGFLSGSYTNPVSVNFITRDFLPQQPYTRIKYYQGSSGEAMIDGLFNQRIYNKFDFYFDFTNRKTDGYYHNSAYSEWMTKLRLKYYLNEKIDIIGDYDFEYSKTGLFGGVNVDSLINNNLDINSYLYSQFQAPVNQNNAEQGYKFHYFNLRLLSTYLDSSLSDLNLYYKYDNNEVRNPSDSADFKSVYKNKIYGISFKQDYNKSIFAFKLNGAYESSDIRYYTLTDSINNYYPVSYKNYSVSAVGSAYLIDSSVVPSIFIKLAGESGNNYLPELNGTYSGYGADISYNPSEFIKLYLGFSNFKTSAAAGFSQAYEAGVTASAGGLFADLMLFRRNTIMQNNVYPFLNQTVYTSGNLSGIGVKVNYLIWKFLIETRTSYYQSGNSSELLYLFPKISFSGGLYYRNIVFDNNLDVKAGINYDFIGNRNSQVGELGANWKMDLTAAGEIKKVVMIYFTFENLFDSQYYIIPYYPMYRRGLRIGLAWELFN